MWTRPDLEMFHFNLMGVLCLFLSFFFNQISCLFLVSQMLSEQFLFGLVWCGLIQQGVASFLVQGCC